MSGILSGESNNLPKKLNLKICLLEVLSTASTEVESHFQYTRTSCQNIFVLSQSTSTIVLLFLEP